MKVLHIISSPAAGGAETYVRDISLGMAAEGHAVHVLFLQSAGDSGRDAGFETAFLAELTAAGIGHSFIGVQARLAPWRGVAAVRRAVAAFQPDVLHCHLYYALVFSLFVSGVSVVYTHHSFRLKVPRWLYRLFELRVSAYVGICHAVAGMLEATVSKPVFRIDNGVSSHRLMPRLNRDCSGQPVRLAFVGRLCDAKNIDLVLEACEVLRASHFELRIAGEGPERQRLQQKVVDLDLAGKVHFLGNISTVAQFLHDADAFVMCSAWEGLPIALIEATMTGLPVLVTNVGGCAEPVHACGNGLVVDGLAVSDYAAALAQIIDDEDMRKGFSRNALRYGVRYRIERSVLKHLDLYQHISAG